MPPEHTRGVRVLQGYEMFAIKLYISEYDAAYLVGDVNSTKFMYKFF